LEKWKFLANLKIEKKNGNFMNFSKLKKWKCLANLKIGKMDFFLQISKLKRKMEIS